MGLVELSTIPRIIVMHKEIAWFCVWITSSAEEYFFGCYRPFSVFIGIIRELLFTGKGSCQQKSSPAKRDGRFAEYITGWDAASEKDAHENSTLLNDERRTWVNEFRE
ncbi:MAG TPA: hypothetical protein DCE41_37120 [Cytophagales bacterium]|nr:hypothetical protein [Cytophagales bacterium]HAA22265.1 hypothetical protein [Cytophagales bacterium]HAP59893.1 hypothetical protein [Cytophagales bacterium]